MINFIEWLRPVTYVTGRNHSIKLIIDRNQWVVEVLLILSINYKQQCFIYYLFKYCLFFRYYWRRRLDLFIQYYVFLTGCWSNHLLIQTKDTDKKLPTTGSD